MTRGAAMRYERVTPSGTPACTNPRKRGVAEQEQNGVMTPNSAANTFPVVSRLPFRRYKGTENPDPENNKC